VRRLLSLRLAWREGRSGVRRLGVFMGAVALGVGALTGLHAFQQDAADAARGEARELLGGDLRLQSAAPFDDDLEARLDSLEASGAVVARVVTLASVVQAPGSNRNRLLQVNAVDETFPLVGTVQDAPVGSWGRFAAGGSVVAALQVLLQLSVEPGDTVRLGEARLQVAGSVQGLPVDLGIQTIVGPPIFMSLADLPATGLLGFGSLVQYRAFVLLPPGQDPGSVARELRSSLDGRGVGVRTAQAEAEAFAEGFRSLARFLGLVGLMALLLGGIGVASAVHVYVQDRIPSVAVLRCLGAPEGMVFRIYLLQAVALGLGGALVGLMLGLVLQFMIPTLLGGILPFELQPRLRPWTLAAGMAVGTWTAFLFALLPLLRVREIPPLAALRSQVEAGSVRRTLPRAATVAGLALTLFALSALQTGGAYSGLVFAGALLGVLGALGVLASGLARAARRLLPPAAPFPLRQGIAGLFRPGNQTGAVVTALGFGAFLLGALAVVEGGLRASLILDPDRGEPSLLLFDIQEDQRDPVEALLAREGVATTLVPLAPARLLSLRGTPVEELRRAGELPGWMVRRVFRNTWREELSDTERLIAGHWWDGRDPAEVAHQVAGGAVRVSLEEEIAAELGVAVGDEIVWDVQGRPLSSVVTSLRRVDWASFRPNFYAVFEPGALDGAPVTYVGLVPAMETGAGVRLQNALLEEAPNLSFLDVSVIRETVERISGQVVRALRVLAAFATAAGFLVLFAALLSGRFRRRRESALLKTLGAGGGTIRGTLLSEYLVLGAVGATSGLLLGVGGGALALTLVFQHAVTLSPGLLAGLWLGLVALTVVAGWSISGPVLREPPLVTLREAEG
jgi:putative ABC transport system permease protein